MAKRHIIDVKNEKSNAHTEGLHLNNHVSLFRYLVNSNMPESELSIDRLTKEAQILFGGGTVTTARTLDFTSYYILANQHIKSRLKEELKEIMAKFPEKVPSTKQLQKLPYLQAIIKEGLRYVWLGFLRCWQKDLQRLTDDRAHLTYSLSYGVMHNLPHCSPDVPIQYQQWTIPTGVRYPTSLPCSAHTNPYFYYDSGSGWHVCLLDAHWSNRVREAIWVHTRTMAWPKQPPHEQELGPLQSRLPELFRNEVSRHRSPQSLSPLHLDCPFFSTLQKNIYIYEIAREKKSFYRTTHIWLTCAKPLFSPVLV